jgi:hypothetical protein
MADGTETWTLVDGKTGRQKTAGFEEAELW